MKVRKKNYRAQQFMPFSPLKGYYELILAAEQVKEEKRMLSEEQCEVINSQLQALAKGMLVVVTYFSGDRYAVARGRVTQFEPVLERLRVEEVDISFSDVYAVERISQSMI